MKAALALVLLAACGDDTQVPFDAPPDLPVDTLPGMVARGTVVAWQSPTANGAGIAGARVCLYGAAHCVTTDAAGAYELDGVPATGKFSITVDVAGYVRTLVVQPAAAGATISIMTDAIAQSRVTGAGGTYPLLDKGLVETATSPPVAGLTLTMTPSGTAVYLGGDGHAQAGLTVTGAEGGALFVNLSAAGYTIAGSGEPCHVPVESGTVSFVVTSACPSGTL